MKAPIRVLIADDHTLVRDALKALLNEQEGIQVVASADDGVDALTQCAEKLPDVALIDIVMPRLNGIEAATQIHQRFPQIRIVIVSMHADIDYVYRALRAGAHGYVAKTSTAADLVRAIRTVSKGRRFLSAAITESVLDDYIHARSSKSPLEQLSGRERQILQLLCEGRSSTAIASVLSLSPKTIDTYRSRMMEKLGISEFPALVKFAILHGITPPG
jgi:two-component system, NarL family, response regulator NreC